MSITSKKSKQAIQNEKDFKKSLESRGELVFDEDKRKRLTESFYLPDTGAEAEDLNDNFIPNTMLVERKLLQKNHIDRLRMSDHGKKKGFIERQIL